MENVTAKLCLDIGCGYHCHPGFVGMDIRAIEGVEIVHDAEVIPWPVESGSCSVIKVSHLIEHIKPWLQIPFIDECWRAMEVGGVLMISTPYGGSKRYYQDPTHCSPWIEATPKYFVKGTHLYDVYKPLPWAIHEVYGRAQIFWNIRGDLEFALTKVSVENEFDVRVHGGE